MKQPLSTAMLASRISQTNGELFSHHEHILGEKLLPDLLFSKRLYEKVNVYYFALHYRGKVVLVKEHEVVSSLREHSLFKDKTDKRR